MKKFIAIDIGGTAIKYGIISEKGDILEKDRKPSQAHLGGSHIIQSVINIIESYLNVMTVEGICVSTAGIVDPVAGKIIHANENIPNYTGINIKEIIENRFSIPCIVENDVACAGLAEISTEENVVSGICLTIGTGIGCSVIVDNKVFHGASYSAGEVGYMNILGGQLEELASTSALVKSIAKIKGDEPDLWNGLRIFEEAKKGDKDCIQEIDKLCHVLGCGIANICYVLNPEIVIIGGGIAEQGDYLYDLIRFYMDKYLIEEIGKNTKLRFAKLGNDAGMIGAFYNYKKQLER